MVTSCRDGATRRLAFAASSVKTGSVDDLTFDDLVTWLMERDGQHTELSIGTSSGGNTGAHTRGVLRITDDPAGLIDPRPGRVFTLALADTHVQLVEGDFVRAELMDEFDGVLRSGLIAEFQEIHMIFSAPGTR